MIYSYVLLAILVIFMMAGLFKHSFGDFKIGEVGVIVFILAVFGLNFIKKQAIWGTEFSIGTLIFYFGILFLIFYRSSVKNVLLTLIISFVFTGIVYILTRMAIYFNNAYFSDYNAVYGAILGITSSLITKNAKYSTISGGIGTLFIAITFNSYNPFALNLYFEWAILSIISSLIVCEFLLFLIRKKPDKMSYYLEFGKMVDE